MKTIILTHTHREAIRLFSSDDATRFMMNGAEIRSGQLNVTDGRILARVPIESGDHELTVGKDLVAIAAKHAGKHGKVILTPKKDGQINIKSRPIAGFGSPCDHGTEPYRGKFPKVDHTDIDEGTEMACVVEIGPEFLEKLAVFARRVGGTGVKLGIKEGDIDAKSGNCANGVVGWEVVGMDSTAREYRIARGVVMPRHNTKTIALNKKS